jgi:hypothetical protein
MRISFPFRKIFILVFWISIEVAFGKNPSLLNSLKSISSIKFCREKVPLKNPEILERFEKEFMLTVWNEPQVILWLKRSNRFFPIIENILKQNKLPDDLKYVAVVESSLLPHIGSSKGAVGFWQFTEKTGKIYGLEINSKIDERKNIIKSTEAAVSYFKVLYDTLDSWTLTAAAYNMGENGLLAELDLQGTRDYYKLYLPLETQRFIFKIISVKLILSDPEKYGFKLSADDLYSPIHFERINFKGFDEIPVRVIAQAARTSFKDIKDLNPEIKGYFVQGGPRSILIPEGASKGFEKRFNKLLDKWITMKEQQLYIVQEGDNLYSISERFNVPLKSLCIWNHLDENIKIHPGDRLIIFYNK